MGNYEIYKAPSAEPDVGRDVKAEPGRTGADADARPAGQPVALSPAPVENASIGQRLLARVVDAVILGVVDTILSALITQTTPVWWDVSVRALTAIVYLVYYVWPYSTTGQTLGKRIFGIRVVSIDGTRLNWRTALLRTAGDSVSALPLGLGYLWALWDRDRQTWHDKLAGTCVVPAWVTPEQLQAAIPPEVARRRQRRWLLALGLPSVALAATCIVASFAAYLAQPIWIQALEAAGLGAPQVPDEDYAALVEALSQRLGAEAASSASINFNVTNLIGDEAPSIVWLTIEVSDPGACSSTAAAGCERLADDLARIVLENYSRVDELAGIEIAVTQDSQFIFVDVSNTLVDKALTIEEWQKELGVGNS